MNNIEKMIGLIEREDLNIEFFVGTVGPPKIYVCYIYAEPNGDIISGEGKSIFEAFKDSYRDLKSGQYKHPVQLENYKERNV